MSGCDLSDVFFFKQKTAYEMRISDWSSDVCSSDLYAREALTQWYHLLHAGKLASVSLEKFQIITGLKLVDEHGTLLDKLPPIPRWLNRIPALRIPTQDAFFEEYMGLIQARDDDATNARTPLLGGGATRPGPHRPI